MCMVLTAKSEPEPEIVRAKTSRLTLLPPTLNSGGNMPLLNVWLQHLCSCTSILVQQNYGGTWL